MSGGNLTEPIMRSYDISCHRADGRFALQFSFLCEEDIEAIVVAHRLSAGYRYLQIWRGENLVYEQKDESRLVLATAHALGVHPVRPALARVSG